MAVPFTTPRASALYQNFTTGPDALLNLDQIHIFLAVARNLSFSRAAEELYISQPAVSASISKLESQAGVSLFHRIGRRVELTDEGRHLLKEGDLLLDQSQKLEQDLRKFKTQERGSLRLAANYSVGNHWLPKRLARFRLLHPGVELLCHLGNPETILTGFNEGQFDLIILCGRRPSETSRVAGEERMTLVVGRTHPWFGKDPIQTEQLRRANWLIREPGSSARLVLEKNLQEINLEPNSLNIHQVLYSNEMAKAMAIEGSGVAALPTSVVSQEVKLGTLWSVDIANHVWQSEPVWIDRPKQQEKSLLAKKFETMILNDGSNI